MSIEKSMTPKTVKAIIKGQEKFRFDLLIQRNNVWDNKRKSLFIHSLIYGYPVPAMYAQDNGDGYYWMIEGKQRLSTLIEFPQNTFKLHKDTPDVDGAIIAGLSFEELPEEFQDKIYDTNMQIYQLRGIKSEEERNEIFLRLNGGKPLSGIELTRVAGGEGMIKYLQELSQQPFFNNNITGSQRNGCKDEELILQCLILYFKGATSINANAIREFVDNIDVDDLPKDEILEITDYLNRTFLEKKSYLKKSSIPVIFEIAGRYKDSISEYDFALQTDKFFNSVPEAYSEACKAGNAKESSVRVRIEELERFLLDNVDIKDVKKETEEASGEEVAA